MKAILLVGAPRCGKTQLALQMCENKRSVFGSADFPGW